MKTPENREENPQDPLDRIKEIDKLFRTQQRMVVEDAERNEIRWTESEDAKQLLEEKEEIIKSNSGNPDFALAYAAYQAPKEGKETAEKEQFRKIEKESIKQHINELEESLRKANAYLKKLESEE